MSAGPGEVSRPLDSGREELTWVEADAYVRASGVGDTVVVLSVTTRNGRFAPTLYRDHLISTEGTSIEVTLGRTTFGDLPGRPVGVAGALGARRYGYSEIYYFGNPGYYQTFAYSINDAGYVPRWGVVELLSQRGGVNLGQTEKGSPLDETAVEAYLADPLVERARRESVVNTLTVTAPMASLDAGPPGWLGADLDIVRTFPDKGLRRRLRDRPSEMARRIRRRRRVRTERSG
jgi:hypothetical protein